MRAVAYGGLSSINQIVWDTQAATDLHLRCRGGGKYSPPILGFGGSGVGISGAFYGLWTVIGVTYAAKWWPSLAPKSRNYKWLIVQGILWFVGLLHAVTAVLQYPVSQGVGTGAQLAGVVMGVLRAGSPLYPSVKRTWARWAA